MNEVNNGTLYLVPTPIGNLSDITQRAIDILANVDIIAAEDTRHTKLLLNHFNIHKRIIAYHEHNKHVAGEYLIEQLRIGKSIAQCSDAGMPVISDPGYDLVKKALTENISIIPLPGANAALTALIASGLDSRQFVFIGFLPKTNTKKKKILKDISNLSMTLIFYEAPHRLKETLDILLSELGNRYAVLARELTKKFETFERNTLSELRKKLDQESARGEYVILVEGFKDTEIKKEEVKKDWKKVALSLVESEHLKDVSRKIAVEFNLSRREVYQYLISKKKD